MLQRSSEVPLYEQLASLIAEWIASGALAPGDRLPTEAELMREHGVGRITVRQAVARLVRNGQVVTRRGKGSFVTASMRRHDLGSLHGFHDALRAQGLEPQTRLLEFSTSAGRSDKWLPEGLDLPVRLTRLYSLEEQPFAVVQAWLPAAAAGLGEERAANLTTYEIVEQFLGERVSVADVAIRCETPPTRVSRWLRMPPRGPVLVMERRSLSNARRVLEFLRIHIVPERYEFCIRLPGPIGIARSIQRTLREPHPEQMGLANRMKSSWSNL